MAIIVQDYGSIGGGGTFDFSNATCVSGEKSGHGTYGRTFNVAKTSNVIYAMFTNTTAGNFTDGTDYDLLNNGLICVVKIDNSGSVSFVNRIASSINNCSLSGSTLSISASDGNINGNHYFGIFEFAEL